MHLPASEGHAECSGFCGHVLLHGRSVQERCHTSTAEMLLQEREVSEGLEIFPRVLSKAKRHNSSTALPPELESSRCLFDSPVSAAPRCALLTALPTPV